MLAVYSCIVYERKDDICKCRQMTFVSAGRKVEFSRNETINLPRDAKKLHVHKAAIGHILCDLDKSKLLNIFHHLCSLTINFDALP